jgi:PAS domain S-box-containing protein
MMDLAVRNGHHRFEWVHLMSDGTEFLVEAMLTPIAIRGKQFLHVVWRDISERKQAEELLQESETLQRTLLANLPAGVIIIDPVTRMIENVNNAAAAMFGVQADHIIGHRCHAFLCPASEGACPVCDLGKEVDNAERAMICADGSRRPVLKSVKRIQIGGQEKLLECFVDIAERKEAETAFRESEARYRIAIEASYDGVAIVQNKVHIYVNQAFLDIFRYKALDEIIGNHNYCVIHPDDYERVVGYVEARQKGEYAPTRYEFRGIRRDGTPIDVEVSVDTISYKGEKAILAYLRDITERKQAQKTLDLSAQRTEALLRLNQMTTASLKEITDFTLEAAVQLTGSRIGYLAFLNEDESVLTMHSWSQTAMTECTIAEKPINYPVEETGLWGEAVRQRKPVITNNYSAPNTWKKGYPEGHVQILRHMNIPVFAESRIVLVAGVGNKDEEYHMTDAQQLTLLMEGMWRLIEHKKAEKALREAQDMLQIAVAQSPSGILIADAPDVRIRIANPAAFAIRGGNTEILTDIAVAEHSQKWQTFYPDGTPVPPEGLPLSKAILRGETVQDLCITSCSLFFLFLAVYL